MTKEKLIKNVCKGCGAMRSAPLKNDVGQDVFWFGAMKGTTDFSILMSSLKFAFLLCSSPDYPSGTESQKFDFFCSDCFKKNMQENERQQRLQHDSDDGVTYDNE